MDYLCNTWDLVLTGLKKQLSDIAVNTWFDEVRIQNFSDSCMTLLCQNEFKLETIRMHFLTHVQDVLEELFGRKFRVEITGNDAEMPVKGIPSGIEKQFRFDTFITDSSNILAYTLVKKLSENGILPHNPIFLYGASGVGKTHLLYACCQEMKVKFKEKNILAVGAEELTNELIRSIRTGGEATAAFQKKYRTLDVLFVDDIQFIAGKNQTQVEFYNIFNAIAARGGQIVLTSDLPPKATAVLDERLRTRFEGGVMAEIGQPDAELVRCYIEKKTQESGLPLSQECKSYLEQHLSPSQSIRSVDGALNLLAVVYELTGKPVTVETIRKDLKYYLYNSKTIEPDEVLTYVAKCYHCQVEDLVGKSRAREISNARMIAIHLLRSVLGMSLISIGEIFQRDHSTILYSIEKLNDLKKKNENLNQEIIALEQNLRNIDV